MNKLRIFQDLLRKLTKMKELCIVKRNKKEEQEGEDATALSERARIYPIRPTKRLAGIKILSTKRLIINLIMRVENL